VLEPRRPGARARAPLRLRTRHDGRAREGRGRGAHREPPGSTRAVVNERPVQRSDPEAVTAFLDLTEASMARSGQPGRSSARCGRSTRRS